MNELDAAQTLRSRRLDLVPKEGFKVVEVAQLARLTDTFAAREALVTVKLQAVVDVGEEAHEEEQGADRRARPSLSRVAVHDQDVLRVSCKAVSKG